MELVHITPAVLGHFPNLDPTSSNADMATMAARLPAWLSELGWNVTVIAASPVPVEGQGLAKHVTPIRAQTTRHEVECDVFEASLDHAHARLFLLATEPRPQIRLDEALSASNDDIGRQLDWTVDFVAAAAGLMKRLGIRPDILHLHGEALAASFLLPPPDKGLVVSLYDPQKEGLFSADAFLEAAGLPPLDSSLQGQTAAQVIVPQSDLLLLPSPGVAFQLRISKRRMALKKAITEHSQVHSVIGGIHSGRYNPALDPALPARFDAKDLSGKQTCRKQLQRRLGLAPRKDAPLALVTVGQTAEDGSDQIDAVARDILDRDVQLIAYRPKGAPSTPNLEHLAQTEPERIAMVDAGQLPLTWLMAGSDILIHAPHYSPWGRFIQLGMAFGAIAVARGTGAIDNLVVDFDPNTKTGGGFKYRRESADELLRTLDRARSAFPDKKAWMEMMRRNMEATISWERAAARVNELYHTVVMDTVSLPDVAQS